MDTQLQIDRTKIEIQRLEGCISQLHKERAFAKKIPLLLILALPIGFLINWRVASLVVLFALGIPATILYLTSIRMNEYQGMIRDHHTEIRILNDKKKRK